MCSANIGLSPIVSRSFLKIGITDPAGISKPFDADGNATINSQHFCNKTFSIFPVFFDFRDVITVSNTMRSNTHAVDVFSETLH